MDDSISRRAAIDVISIHLNKTDVPVSYPGIIKALEELLNDLPSAQPERQENEPTVMVYDNDMVNASCSNCQSIIPGYKVSEYSFCPYCGGKIAGERWVKYEA